MSVSKKDIKDISELIRKKLELYMNVERRETRFDPRGRYTTTPKMHKYDFLYKVLDSSVLDSKGRSPRQDREGQTRPKSSRQSPDRSKSAKRVTDRPKSSLVRSSHSPRRERRQNRRVISPGNEKRRKLEESRSKSGSRKKDVPADRAGKSYPRPDTTMDESSLVSESVQTNASSSVHSRVSSNGIKPRLDDSPSRVVLHREKDRLSTYATKIFSEVPVDEIQLIHRYRPYYEDNGEPKYQGYSRHVGSILKSKNFVQFYNNEALQHSLEKENTDSREKLPPTKRSSKPVPRAIKGRQGTRGHDDVIRTAKSSRHTVFSSLIDTAGTGTRLVKTTSKEFATSSIESLTPTFTSSFHNIDTSTFPPSHDPYRPSEPDRPPSPGERFRHGRSVSIASIKSTVTVNFNENKLEEKDRSVSFPIIKHAHESQMTDERASKKERKSKQAKDYTEYYEDPNTKVKVDREKSNVEITKHETIEKDKQLYNIKQIVVVSVDDKKEQDEKSSALEKQESIEHSENDYSESSVETESVDQHEVSDRTLSPISDNELSETAEVNEKRESVLITEEMQTQTDEKAKEEKSVTIGDVQIMNAKRHGCLKPLRHSPSPDLTNERRRKKKNVKDTNDINKDRKQKDPTGNNETIKPVTVEEDKVEKDAKETMSEFKQNKESKTIGDDQKLDSVDVRTEQQEEVKDEYEDDFEDETATPRDITPRPDSKASEDKDILKQEPISVRITNESLTQENDTVSQITPISKNMIQDVNTQENDNHVREIHDTEVNVEIKPSIDRTDDQLINCVTENIESGPIPTSDDKTAEKMVANIQKTEFKFDSDREVQEKQINESINEAESETEQADNECTKQCSTDILVIEETKVNNVDNKDTSEIVSKTNEDNDKQILVTENKVSIKEKVEDFKRSDLSGKGLYILNSSINTLIISGADYDPNDKKTAKESAQNDVSVEPTGDKEAIPVEGDLQNTDVICDSDTKEKGSHSLQTQTISSQATQTLNSVQIQTISDMQTQTINSTSTQTVTTTESQTDKQRKMSVSSVDSFLVAEYAQQNACEIEMVDIATSPIPETLFIIAPKETVSLVIGDSALLPVEDSMQIESDIKEESEDTALSKPINESVALEPVETKNNETRIGMDEEIIPSSQNKTNDVMTEEKSSNMEFKTKEEKLSTDLNLEDQIPIPGEEEELYKVPENERGIETNESGIAEANENVDEKTDKGVSHGDKIQEEDKGFISQENEEKILVGLETDEIVETDNKIIGKVIEVQQPLDKEKFAEEMVSVEENISREDQPKEVEDNELKEETIYKKDIDTGLEERVTRSMLETDTVTTCKQEVDVLGTADENDKATPKDLGEVKTNEIKQETNTMEMIDISGHVPAENTDEREECSQEESGTVYTEEKTLVESERKEDEDKMNEKSDIVNMTAVLDSNLNNSPFENLGNVSEEIEIDNQEMKVDVKKVCQVNDEKEDTSSIGVEEKPVDNNDGAVDKVRHDMAGSENIKVTLDADVAEQTFEQTINEHEIQKKADTIENVDISGIYSENMSVKPDGNLQIKKEDVSQETQIALDEKPNTSGEDSLKEETPLSVKADISKADSSKDLHVDNRPINTQTNGAKIQNEIGLLEHGSGESEMTMKNYETFAENDIVAKFEEISIATTVDVQERKEINNQNDTIVQEIGGDGNDVKEVLLPKEALVENMTDYSDEKLKPSVETTCEPDGKSEEIEKRSIYKEEEKETASDITSDEQSVSNEGDKKHEKRDSIQENETMIVIEKSENNIPGEKPSNENNEVNPTDESNSGHCLIITNDKVHNNNEKDNGEDGVAQDVGINNDEGYKISEEQLETSKVHEAELSKNNDCNKEVDMNDVKSEVDLDKEDKPKYFQLENEFILAAKDESIPDVNSDNDKDQSNDIEAINHNQDISPDIVTTHMELKREEEEDGKISQLKDEGTVTQQSNDEKDTSFEDNVTYNREIEIDEKWTIQGQGNTPYLSSGYDVLNKMTKEGNKTEITETISKPTEYVQDLKPSDDINITNLETDKESQKIGIMVEQSNAEKLSQKPDDAIRVDNEISTLLENEKDNKETDITVRQSDEEKVRQQPDDAKDIRVEYVNSTKSEFDIEVKESKIINTQNDDKEEIRDPGQSFQTEHEILTTTPEQNLEFEEKITINQDLDTCLKNTYEDNHTTQRVLETKVEKTDTTDIPNDENSTLLQSNETNDVDLDYKGLTTTGESVIENKDGDSIQKPGDNEVIQESDNNQEHEILTTTEEQEEEIIETGPISEFQDTFPDTSNEPFSETQTVSETESDNADKMGISSSNKIIVQQADGQNDESLRVKILKTDGSDIETDESKIHGSNDLTGNNQDLSTDDEILRSTTDKENEKREIEIVTIDQDTSSVTMTDNTSIIQNKFDTKEENVELSHISADEKKIIQQQDETNSSSLEENIVTDGTPNKENEVIHKQTDDERVGQGSDHNKDFGAENETDIAKETEEKEIEKAMKVTHEQENVLDVKENGDNVTSHIDIKEENKEADIVNISCNKKDVISKPDEIKDLNSENGNIETKGEMHIDIKEGKDNHRPIDDKEVIEGPKRILDECIEEVLHDKSDYTPLSTQVSIQVNQKEVEMNQGVLFEKEVEATDTNISNSESKVDNATFEVIVQTNGAVDTEAELVSLTNENEEIVKNVQKEYISNDIETDESKILHESNDLTGYNQDLSTDDEILRSTTDKENEKREIEIVTIDQDTSSVTMTDNTSIIQNKFDTKEENVELSHISADEKKIIQQQDETNSSSLEENIVTDRTSNIENEVIHKQTDDERVGQGSDHNKDFGAENETDIAKETKEKEIEKAMKVTHEQENVLDIKENGDNVTSHIDIKEENKEADIVNISCNKKDVISKPDEIKDLKSENGNIETKGEMQIDIKEGKDNHRPIDDKEVIEGPKRNLDQCIEEVLRDQSDDTPLSTQVSIQANQKEVEMNQDVLFEKEVEATDTNIPNLESKVDNATLAVIVQTNDAVDTEAELVSHTNENEEIGKNVQKEYISNDNEAGAIEKEIIDKYVPVSERKDEEEKQISHEEENAKSKVDELDKISATNNESDNKEIAANKDTDNANNGHLKMDVKTGNDEEDVYEKIIDNVDKAPMQSDIGLDKSLEEINVGENLSSKSETDCEKKESRDICRDKDAVSPRQENTTGKDKDTWLLEESSSRKLGENGKQIATGDSREVESVSQNILRTEDKKLNHKEDINVQQEVSVSLLPNNADRFDDKASAKEEVMHDTESTGKSDTNEITKEKLHDRLHLQEGHDGDGVSTTMESVLVQEVPTTENQPSSMTDDKKNLVENNNEETHYHNLEPSSVNKHEDVKPNDDFIPTEQFVRGYKKADTDEKATVSPDKEYKTEVIDASNNDIDDSLKKEIASKLVSDTKFLTTGDEMKVVKEGEDEDKTVNLPENSKENEIGENTVNNIGTDLVEVGHSIVKGDLLQENKDDVKNYVTSSCTISENIQTEKGMELESNDILDELTENITEMKKADNNIPEKTYVQSPDVKGYIQAEKGMELESNDILDELTENITEMKKADNNIPEKTYVQSPDVKGYIQAVIEKSVEEAHLQSRDTDVSLKSDNDNQVLTLNEPTGTDNKNLQKEKDDQADFRDFSKAPETGNYDKDETKTYYSPASEPIESLPAIVPSYLEDEAFETKRSEGLSRPDTEEIDNLKIKDLNENTQPDEDSSLISTGLQPECNDTEECQGKGAQDRYQSEINEELSGEVKTLENRHNLESDSVKHDEVIEEHSIIGTANTVKDIDSEAATAIVEKVDSISEEEKDKWFEDKHAVVISNDISREKEVEVKDFIENITRVQQDEARDISQNASSPKERDCKSSLKIQEHDAIGNVNEVKENFEVQKGLETQKTEKSPQDAESQGSGLEDVTNKQESEINELVCQTIQSKPDDYEISDIQQNGDHQTNTSKEEIQISIPKQNDKNKEWQEHVVTRSLDEDRSGSVEDCSKGKCVLNDGKDAVPQTSENYLPKTTSVTEESQTSKETISDNSNTESYSSSSEDSGQSKGETSSESLTVTTTDIITDNTLISTVCEENSTESATQTSDEQFSQNITDKLVTAGEAGSSDKIKKTCGLSDIQNKIEGEMSCEGNQTAEDETLTNVSQITSTNELSQSLIIKESDKSMDSENEKIEESGNESNVSKSDVLICDNEIIGENINTGGAENQDNLQHKDNKSLTSETDEPQNLIESPSDNINISSKNETQSDGDSDNQDTSQGISEKSFTSEIQKNAEGNMQHGQMTLDIETAAKLAIQDNKDTQTISNNKDLEQTKDLELSTINESEENESKSSSDTLSMSKTPVRSSEESPDSSKSDIEIFQTKPVIENLVENENLEGSLNHVDESEKPHIPQGTVSSNDTSIKSEPFADDENLKKNEKRVDNILQTNFTMINDPGLSDLKTDEEEKIENKLSEKCPSPADQYKINAEIDEDCEQMGKLTTYQKTEWDLNNTKSNADCLNQSDDTRAMDEHSIETIAEKEYIDSLESKRSSTETPESVVKEYDAAADKDKKNYNNFENIQTDPLLTKTETGMQNEMAEIKVIEKERCQSGDDASEPKETDVKNDVFVAPIPKTIDTLSKIDNDMYEENKQNTDNKRESRSETQIELKENNNNEEIECSLVVIQGTEIQNEFKEAKISQSESAKCPSQEIVLETKDTNVALNSKVLNTPKVTENRMNEENEENSVTLSEKNSETQSDLKDNIDTNENECSPEIDSDDKIVHDNGTGVSETSTTKQLKNLTENTEEHGKLKGDAESADIHLQTDGMEKNKCTTTESASETKETCVDDKLAFDLKGREMLTDSKNINEINDENSDNLFEKRIETQTELKDNDDTNESICLQKGDGDDKGLNPNVLVTSKMHENRSDNTEENDLHEREKVSVCLEEMNEKTIEEQIVLKVTETIGIGENKYSALDVTTERKECDAQAEETSDCKTLPEKVGTQFVFENKSEEKIKEHFEEKINEECADDSKVNLTDAKNTDSYTTTEIEKEMPILDDNAIKGHTLETDTSSIDDQKDPLLLEKRSPNQPVSVEKPIIGQSTELEDKEEITEENLLHVSKSNVITSDNMKGDILTNTEEDERQDSDALVLEPNEEVLNGKDVKVKSVSEDENNIRIETSNVQNYDGIYTLSKETEMRISNETLAKNAERELEAGPTDQTKEIISKYDKDSEYKMVETEDSSGDKVNSSTTTIKEANLENKIQQITQKDHNTPCTSQQIADTGDIKMSKGGEPTERQLNFETENEANDQICAFSTQSKKETTHEDLDSECKVVEEGDILADKVNADIERTEQHLEQVTEIKENNTTSKIELTIDHRDVNIREPKETKINPETENESSDKTCTTDTTYKEEETQNDPNSECKIVDERDNSTEKVRSDILSKEKNQESETQQVLEMSDINTTPVGDQTADKEDLTMSIRKSKETQLSPETENEASVKICTFNTDSVEDKTNADPESESKMVEESDSSADKVNAEIRVQRENLNNETEQVTEMKDDNITSTTERSIDLDSLNVKIREQKETKINSETENDANDETCTTDIKNKEEEMHGDPSSDYKTIEEDDCSAIKIESYISFKEENQEYDSQQVTEMLNNETSTSELTIGSGYLNGVIMESNEAQLKSETDNEAKDKSCTDTESIDYKLNDSPACHHSEETPTYQTKENINHDDKDSEYAVLAEGDSSEDKENISISIKDNRENDTQQVTEMKNDSTTSTSEQTADADGLNVKIGEPKETQIPEKENKAHNETCSTNTQSLEEKTHEGHNLESKVEEENDSSIYNVNTGIAFKEEDRDNETQQVKDIKDDNTTSTNEETINSGDLNENIGEPKEIKFNSETENDKTNTTDTKSNEAEINNDPNSECKIVREGESSEDKVKPDTVVKQENLETEALQITEKNDNSATSTIESVGDSTDINVNIGKSGETQLNPEKGNEANYETCTTDSKSNEPKPNKDPAVNPFEETSTDQAIENISHGNKDSEHIVVDEDSSGAKNDISLKEENLENESKQITEMNDNNTTSSSEQSAYSGDLNVDGGEPKEMQFNPETKIEAGDKTCTSAITFNADKPQEDPNSECKVEEDVDSSVDKVKRDIAIEERSSENETNQVLEMKDNNSPSTSELTADSEESKTTDETKSNSLSVVDPTLTQVTSESDSTPRSTSEDTSYTDTFETLSDGQTTAESRNITSQTSSKVGSQHVKEMNTAEPRRSSLSDLEELPLE